AWRAWKDGSPGAGLISVEGSQMTVELLFAGSGIVDGAFKAPLAAASCTYSAKREVRRLDPLREAAKFERQRLIFANNCHVCLVGNFIFHAARQRQVNGVDIRGAPDVAVLDAAQDGMACLAPGEDAPRALLAVLAVVIDPGFAQHLPAKAAAPRAVVPGEFRECLPCLDVECMRRGPHADNRPAGFQVIDDMLHLLVRQIAEAREDNHQVGRVERLQAGDVVANIWINRAVPGVNGEEDRALVAMMPGEDPGQLRQSFLGAIFLIAADEDNVLTFTGTIEAVVGDPRVRRSSRRTRQAQ